MSPDGGDHINTGQRGRKSDHEAYQSLFLYGFAWHGGCFTACSGAEKVKSNTPVQITMWNYYNGAQKEEMDRLVQEFNDTVGLEQKIVVESVSKGSVSELEDAVRDSTDGKPEVIRFRISVLPMRTRHMTSGKRIKFRTFVLI